MTDNLLTYSLNVFNQSDEDFSPVNTYIVNQFDNYDEKKFHEHY